MEKLPVGCKENDPDCENCPYPDCIATYKDVFRQDRYKQMKLDEQRDREIVKMRDEGYMVKHIAERFQLKYATVGSILYRANKARKNEDHEKQQMLIV